MTPDQRPIVGVPVNVINGRVYFDGERLPVPIGFSSHSTIPDQRRPSHRGRVG